MSIAMTRIPLYARANKWTTEFISIEKWIAQIDLDECGKINLTTSDASIKQTYAR